MKIVHIEDFFHPDAGYQINILPKYLQKFGHENVIITSQMDKIPETLTSFFGRDHIEQRDSEYEKSGIRIIRLPLDFFVSGRAGFNKELYKTLREEKPDIIYVHGNDTLTGIRVFRRMQKFACPIITDSHMLEMASKNPLSKLFRLWYKINITPIIKKNRIPVIRTQNDCYVEKCLGIPLCQAPWISYGTDTMLFHPDINVKEYFREKYHIAKNDLVFIYTGKLDESKGGMLLAQTFSKKFMCKNKVVLIVVGNTSNDEYGKKIDDLFANSENKILRFPTQKYSQLPQFYQASDVAVFAKQCSLSFYDAQGCGLPVISEDNNINVDRNSHGNGLCFISGNVEDFRHKILQVLDMSAEEYKNMSDAAYSFITKNYNYEEKAKEYERILIEEYNRCYNR